MLKRVRSGLMIVMALVVLQPVVATTAMAASSSTFDRRPRMQIDPLMPERAVLPASAQTIVEQKNDYLDLLKRN
ncbi:MAG: hypothetical protein WCG06_04910 [Candidatus Omnitrophota bacterium]